MTPTLAAQVQAQLLLCPGSTALDVAEVLGARYADVAEALRQLLDEHRVEVVGAQSVTRGGMAAPRYEVGRG